MDKFSSIVKEELSKRKMSISEFASKIEKSPQYVYDMLSRRNKARWNEDSINLACKVLGLELKAERKEVI